MHRSYWDLEVYARDFQERRRQVAARSQLGAEAAAGKTGRAGGNPLKLAFASILSAWNARLGSGPAAGLPESVAEPGLIAADVAGQPHRSARGRLSQPYVDMVVIARGPIAGVTEQPSGVSDC